MGGETGLELIKSLNDMDALAKERAELSKTSKMGFGKKDQEKKNLSPEEVALRERAIQDKMQSVRNKMEEAQLSLRKDDLTDEDIEYL